MRRWLVGFVAVALIVAGCTNPAPASQDDEQPSTGLAFRISRVDLDGDGLSDALNVTLVGSSDPILREDLRIELDGEAVDIGEILAGQRWSPGEGLEIPCAPGVHEYKLFVDDEVRKIHVTECGVPVPQLPPFFQGRLVDGDADGRSDAIELTLLEGGPVRTGELNASMDGHPLRLYENALKSRAARGAIDNGTRLYTACVPDAIGLNLSWKDRPLPQLTVRGCEVFAKGIDAPVAAQGIDVDDDGAQDGWRLALGNASDGPFPLGQVSLAWGNTTGALNASGELAPPPGTWRSGESLVSVCPEAGSLRFSLTIRGQLVLRTFTACERAPGAPLIDVDLAQAADELALTLNFSRVGPLALEHLSDGNATVGGNGTWEQGGTIELACPGGQLTLLYEGRLAFRGPSPC